MRPQAARLGRGSKNLLVLLVSWASLPGTHCPYPTHIQFSSLSQSTLWMYLSSLCHFTLGNCFFPNEFAIQRLQGVSSLHAILEAGTIGFTSQPTMLIGLYIVCGYVHAAAAELRSDRSVSPAKLNILLSASLYDVCLPWSETLNFS